MKTVDYQIPKENMSDLYKNIFQITAAFEKQIVIPKNPNLTIRLCNIGFNIVGFDLDFSYRDPDEKEIQNMKDIYDIRNFNSMKIIKDYDYILLPNSSLTILSKPSLTLRTRYEPLLRTESNLKVLSIERNNDVLFNFENFNEKITELIAKNNPGTRWDKARNLAQEVAKKALEDLCINQVYEEYQKARQIARESPDSVERTLRLYLGK